MQGVACGPGGTPLGDAPASKSILPTVPQDVPQKFAFLLARRQQIFRANDRPADLAGWRVSCDPDMAPRVPRRCAEMVAARAKGQGHDQGYDESQRVSSWQACIQGQPEDCAKDAQKADSSF